MSDLPSYTRWDDVPAGLHTKTQLGRMGLRPSRDQQVAARFYSAKYHRSYDLYAEAEAAPKREMTAAQAEALAQARARLQELRTCSDCGETFSQPLEEGLCDYCRQGRHVAQRRRRAIAAAAAWFDRSDWVILDTETTGLEEPAIVQVGVVDHAGRPLFSSLVNPGREIPPDAARIHGITADMVADAPTWAAALEQLLERLAGRRRVLAYNAEFDESAVVYSCHQVGIEPPAWDWNCAMRLASAWWNDWSEKHGDFKFVGLGRLAAHLQIEHGRAHDATADALATWQALRHIAAEHTGERHEHLSLS